MRPVLALLPLALGACTPCDASVDSQASFDPLCGCPMLNLPAAAITTEAGLAALLHEVQIALYPEQDRASIAVAAHDDLQFFRAWTELDTVGNEPYARSYTIEYDPVVLSDPPSPEALAAVLAHELGHIDDYLQMDSAALLDFAVWYGTEDPTTSASLAEYERATDEKALARGCAEGLSAMRTWIYAHVDADRLAEKQKDYYTPDEITSWVEAHGSCDG
ncbi:hypothetical protein LBMAG42_05140 [Deltaproteobacteria bacterium]|nr:hypothetical protein LBMAG42_05140 [Deltaproteobacteria bacterium]